MEQSRDRLNIIKKIEEYEKNGWFDRDVEDDPPTLPLDYRKVDYTGKKLTTRIQSEIANQVAKHYFDGQIRKKNLVIKNVVGLDNYLSVNGGAVITCNHFNAFDNYAVFKAIQKPLGRRRLYKVIREGNYTSFKGLYGYFFRHCNTLPLCSSAKGLATLFSATDELLKRGEKILIYPEQGMWWNYRKPRPMKDGAFRIAAKSGAPVIPFFITMEDSERTDESTGFPVQEYTVNILKPIYPDATQPARLAARAMADENYAAWKEVYETFYGIPLTY